MGRGIGPDVNLNWTECGELVSLRLPNFALALKDEVIKLSESSPVLKA